MHITCPQCRTALNETHIDHNANIVVCDNCDAVFSPPKQTPAQAYRKAMRFSDIPERFTIVENDADLCISYEHDRKRGATYAVSALLLNGFLWLYMIPIFIQIAQEIISDGDFEFFFLIPFGVLLIFIWIGISMVLDTLKHFFNTVTIDASPKSLRILHRPIRFPFDKRMAVHEIDQIFTKQKVVDSEKRKVHYQVHVKLIDGKTKKLIDRFEDSEQALFIERQIERFLGIENTYVHGEYNPSEG